MLFVGMDVSYKFIRPLLVPVLQVRSVSLLLLRCRCHVAAPFYHPPGRPNILVCFRNVPEG